MIEGPYKARSETKFHRKTGSEKHFYVLRGSKDAPEFYVETFTREAAVDLAEALNLRYRLSNKVLQEVKTQLRPWPEEEGSSEPRPASEIPTTQETIRDRRECQGSLRAVLSA